MPGGKLDKKKQKVVEDKTFGMKNKNKSAKVQAYIGQVEASASNVNDKRAKALEKERQRKAQEKAAAEAHSALIADVSKVVITQQKVSKGGDSKSLLCEYFKRGLCTKGSKCKFSHDLATERKTEKRSIYSTEEEGEKQGDMETWDENTLREVIDKKHGVANRTKIVCRYFITAIEDRKYGWFWQCPNGTDCKYRHALPPGFVLRSLVAKQEEEQSEDKLPLEEIIEQERARLTGVGTPVTLETFTAWKERKRLERATVVETARDEKQRNFLAGRKVGLTGRDLFEFDPTAFQDDDDGMDDYNTSGGAAAEGDDESDGDQGEQQSQTESDDEGGPAEEGPAVAAAAAAATAGGVEVDAGLFAAEDLGDDDDDDAEE